MSTLIIAEAGVNHNGSLDTALQMVEKASACGADVIKFQTFKAESIVTKSARMAEYQTRNLDAQESQYEMLKRLELSPADFQTICAYCKEKKIGFLSTAFDIASICDLLSLDMMVWKIPSGEITNKPYLEAIAKIRKPIILSTGMSTLLEVEDAVSILKRNGCQEMTLLHCTTEYPAPYVEVNLRAIETMKVHFGLPIGYSDHTAGIEVAIAAVAMGASVLEKHFTLDRNMIGPDHKASLEPQEFSQLVKAVRNVEASMGDGVKQPTKSELKNKQVARKSIVAKSYIRRGEVFTANNLTVKRPGDGVSPMLWDEILGAVSDRDYNEDEMIVWYG